jgi:hypothetical protein
LALIDSGRADEENPLDVNTPGSCGNTILAYACGHDQPQIVRALLEAGAILTVCGLPFASLSRRTQAILHEGFCATFASQTVHWWLAPRLERIMNCPAPIGELVLAYTGTMPARPDEDSPLPTSPPTLNFRLTAALGACGASNNHSARTSSSSSSSSSPSSSSSSASSSSSSSVGKGQKRDRPGALQ